MMAHLRMRLVYTTVELSIENKSRPDSGSERHVNQSAFVLASTPACFCKSSSVGIVLYRHFHLKGSAQISNRILSFPMGKEVDVTELARQGIHRSGRSDPDTGNSRVCRPGSLLEHLGYAAQRLGITAIGVRRAFQAG